MSYQAKRKGIELLATGDWTHPLWLHHLQLELEEIGDTGIYQSKKNPDGAKFLLSTEVSCIFSQAGHVYRIHLLIFAPNFSTVEKINVELLKRKCNLHSDGRPILGLSCMEIAEIVFGVDPRCIIIPAHAWTPWFGLYGSRGGFNHLEDAFGKFSDQILAIETGLSSDPAMNWQIGELDTRAIVSFSDAHSPAKMGRELTIFEMPKLSFAELRKALEKNKIAYTIEFYPEEGKYHWDGHRDCGVVQPPQETKQKGVTCPVCGKPLTVGVEYRVTELTTTNVKPESIIQKKDEHDVVFYYHPTQKHRPPFVKSVPLLEIIAECEGVGPLSKTVQEKYNRFIDQFGSELDILLKIDCQRLLPTCGQKITDAVYAVRRGEVDIEPGYDGVYGKVSIPHVEEKDTAVQETLF